MNISKLKIPINGNVCLEALGFPFSITTHFPLTRGMCLGASFAFIYSQLFCFCFVISLINLGDEHKVKVATLSMICFSFFFPPFFCLILFLFLVNFCFLLFIVRSWGSLTTLVLLLLFCLFYEEFLPKILHNITYQILMD